jgi:hypothetical protein
MYIYTIITPIIMIFIQYSRLISTYGRTRSIYVLDIFGDHNMNIFANLLLAGESLIFLHGDCLADGHTRFVSHHLMRFFIIGESDSALHAPYFPQLLLP